MGVPTLRTLAVALLAATLASSAGFAERGTSAASRPPNIVFILADDFSWNLVRFMPHVKRMQKDGVSLARYYVTVSLCCPSRASIFTGSSRTTPGSSRTAAGPAAGRCFTRGASRRTPSPRASRLPATRLLSWASTSTGTRRRGSSTASLRTSLRGGTRGSEPATRTRTTTTSSTRMGRWSRTAEGPRTT